MAPASLVVLVPNARQPDTVDRKLDICAAGGAAALVHRPRGRRGLPPNQPPVLLDTF
jgi:hypothetical protein